MRHDPDTLLVTPEEMAAIDRAAINGGIDGFGLMERAGQAIAAAALRLWPSANRYLILCGPGNNGGDGYVAARALSDAGCEVHVYAVAVETLKGDAARAHDLYAGQVEPLSACRPRPGDVVIDALFGAGLSRDVPDDVCMLVERINAMNLPVVAADLPSGIDGRTGAIRGAALRAAHTVTFVARKPGHVLMPGREHCGTIEVVDIGLPARIVAAHHGHLRINRPDIWRMALPSVSAGSHKFRRGHLAVFSGPAEATGAARLAAAAGLRAGAGLVTLLSPPDALAVNATQLTAAMLHKIVNGDALSALLEDNRLGTFVLGPGFGRPDVARDYVQRLDSRRLVLDADGISAFRNCPEMLFKAFEGDLRLVLTPHDGEFARLFPDLAADLALSKVDRARQAAVRANAVVVLKGADTVIAAPDGRALVNDNAPPWLATAGSGDVLSGIVGAHLAQGMPAFEAAAAAVWRHGAAGARAGEGLTAETLVDAIAPLA